MVARLQAVAMRVCLRVVDVANGAQKPRVAGIKDRMKKNLVKILRTSNARCPPASPSLPFFLM